MDCGPLLRLLVCNEPHLRVIATTTIVFCLCLQNCTRGSRPLRRIRAPSSAVHPWFVCWRRMARRRLSFLSPIPLRETGFAWARCVIVSLRSSCPGNQSPPLIGPFCFHRNHFVSAKVTTAFRFVTTKKRDALRQCAQNSILLCLLVTGDAKFVFEHETRSQDETSRP